MNTTHSLRQLGLALCLIGGLAASGSGSAQTGGLQLENAVFQEVDVTAADGTVTKNIVPAIKVVPGGEVIYRITYRNAGTDPATDINIDNPLPRQLVYAGAKTAPTAVSVDGGAHYGQLGELTVTAADGQTRRARPADVTHLRWTIATLAPGAAGEVAFRAVVK